MTESYKKVTIIVEDEKTIETTVFTKAAKISGSFEPILVPLELENGMTITPPYSNSGELTFGLTAYRDAESGFASSTSTVVKDV